MKGLTCHLYLDWEGREAPNRVPNEVGERTGSDHRPESESGQGEPEQGHDQDFAELADRHGRANLAVGKAEVRQERRRLNEVDLMDDTDRQTGGDQDGKRGFLEEPEGLREGQLLDRILLRGSGGQEQAKRRVAP